MIDFMYYDQFHPPHSQHCLTHLAQYLPLHESQQVDELLGKWHR
jgi:hypothetical protein